MILSNRFKEEDKLRVWVDHPYCAICMSNESCSLHHVTGSRLPYSDSILNSCMLCHVHHKEADGHNVSDREYQTELLLYSIRQILKTNYVFNENDVAFYNMYKDMYNKIQQ